MGNGAPRSERSVQPRIMCFDGAACPTAHKWCQLDAVQVGNFDARRQLAATAAADAAAAAHL